jgi:hypothetical protein
METRMIGSTWRVLLAAPALLLCTAAHAALGGHVGDVAGDATIMHARSLTALNRQGLSYTREQIALPGGGTATEYVDGGGNVFAVSWSAPVIPDLSVLLGSYKANFDSAQLAARDPHAGNRAVRLRSPRTFQADNGEWVVFSAGHLRSFHGYSYLRSQLPAGFSVTELAP